MITPHRQLPTLFLLFYPLSLLACAASKCPLKDKIGFPLTVPNMHSDGSSDCAYDGGVNCHYLPNGKLVPNSSQFCPSSDEGQNNSQMQSTPAALSTRPPAPTPSRSPDSRSSPPSSSKLTHPIAVEPNDNTITTNTTITTRLDTHSSPSSAVTTSTSNGPDSTGTDGTALASRPAAGSESSDSIVSGSDSGSTPTPVIVTSTPTVTKVLTSSKFVSPSAGTGGTNGAGASYWRGHGHAVMGMAAGVVLVGMVL